MDIFKKHLWYTYKDESFKWYRLTLDQVFAREAVDAGSESALASAKGLQDAGSALLEQLTAQVNLSVETTKKLAEAETLENAMALQAGYVKTATEASLKGFSAFSELCSGAVRDAMAPLAAQMTKATKLS